MLDFDYVEEEEQSDNHLMQPVEYVEQIVELVVYDKLIVEFVGFVDFVQIVEVVVNIWVQIVHIFVVVDVVRLLEVDIDFLLDKQLQVRLNIDDLFDYITYFVVVVIILKLVLILL